MKKKLLALVCALALTFSLVGCAISTPDTVGKIGDFEVTSGLYLLAQYDAYQQAAQLADSEQDTSNGTPSSRPPSPPMPTPARPPWSGTYVADKTLETWRPYAAVDARFDELGGKLTEEQVCRRQLRPAADGSVRRYLHCQRHRAGDPEALPAHPAQAHPPAGSCLRQGRRDPRGGRRADRASGQQHVRDRLITVPLYNTSTYAFADDDQKAQMLKLAQKLPPTAQRRRQGDVLGARSAP